MLLGAMLLAASAPSAYASRCSWRRLAWQGCKPAAALPAAGRGAPASACPNSLRQLLKSFAQRARSRRDALTQKKDHQVVFELSGRS